MNDDTLRREALWEQMRERMGQGAIALPTGEDLMNDLVCYGGGAGGGKTHARMILMSNPETAPRPVFWVDEAGDITDEQIERLHHWSHRNALSSEEHERIYGRDWRTLWRDIAPGYLDHLQVMEPATRQRWLEGDWSDIIDKDIRIIGWDIGKEK